MSDRNKAKIEQDSMRVASWLADNHAQFEEQGVTEDSLAGAAQIGGIDQVRAAVDRLENREVVVRWPVAATSPPQFLLKPGRAWPETRDKLSKSTGA
jgi:hypothetical protein